MDESLFPGVSAEVRGVLDYYGTVTLLMEDGFPTTTSHHTPKAPEGKLLGGIYVMEHPELAAKASAVTHITPDKKLPPICIFHGGADASCPVEGALAIRDSFARMGRGNLTVKIYPGYDHDLRYTQYPVTGTMSRAFEDLFDCLSGNRRACVPEERR